MHATAFRPSARVANPTPRRRDEQNAECIECFADRLVSQSDWLSLKRLQGQARVPSAGTAAAEADVMSKCMSQGRSGRVTFGAPGLQGQDCDCYVELFGATKSILRCITDLRHPGEGAIILENRSCHKLKRSFARSDQSLAPSGNALQPNEKPKKDASSGTTTALAPSGNALQPNEKPNAASGTTTADATKKPRENVQKPW